MRASIKASPLHILQPVLLTRMGTILCDKGVLSHDIRLMHVPSATMISTLTGRVFNRPILPWGSEALSPTELAVYVNENPQGEFFYMEDYAQLFRPASVDIEAEHLIWYHGRGTCACPAQARPTHGLPASQSREPRLEKACHFHGHGECHACSSGHQQASCGVASAHHRLCRVNLQAILAYKRTLLTLPSSAAISMFSRELMTNPWHLYAVGVGIIGPVLGSEYFGQYAPDFPLYVTRPGFNRAFDSKYWGAYAHTPVTPWAGLKACYMNDSCC
jgi:hypothetical protein